MYKHYCFYCFDRFILKFYVTLCLKWIDTGLLRRINEPSPDTGCLMCAKIATVRFEQEPKR